MRARVCVRVCVRELRHRCLLRSIQTFIPVETLAATTATLMRSKRCPKCGTNAKSRQLSCCARGGAWFKKCGDPGDPKFGHTWFEGTQACKGYGSSFLVRATAQARRERVVAMLMNSTGLQNTSRTHVKIEITRNMSSGATCEKYQSPIGLTEITALTCLFVVTCGRRFD